MKLVFKNIAQKFAKDRTKLFADPIAKRDMAAQIARRVEEKSHRSLTKKVETAFARAALKPSKTKKFPSLVKQKTRALTKAFTLSQKRAISSFKKTTTKLGVTPSGVKDRPEKYYRLKKRGLPEGMTTRQMGWAPEDPLSEAQKAFYSKSKSPMSKIKRYRKTLSKIYEKPQSWKQRSDLKSLYRAKAKSEIGLAKLERSVYRDTTIQKQTGKTRKGKPIWKTIWTAPKTEFKKW